MRKTLIAAAVAASFLAPVAFAEDAAPEVPALTGNFGVVSNYVFRGISQTQNGPAVQGGFDYAHESGLYVGTWLSNVGWVTRSDTKYKDNNSLEHDIYGGYKFPVGDLGFDVGVISYNYPGKSLPSVRTPDTLEGYIGVTYDVVTLKYNQVLPKSFIGWGGNDEDLGKTNAGTQYIDLTATVPVTEKTAVVAHVGRQNVKNYYQASYTDYKLGVTHDVGFGVVGLAFTTTDSKGTCSATKDLVAGAAPYCWNGKNVSKDVVALSFLKTF